MKAHPFNAGHMPILNQAWASEVLGIPMNPHKGPDLIDDKKVVEVKFALFDPDGPDKKISWRTLEHQLTYPDDYELPGFWALGEYWMDRPVSKVTKEDARDPEVLERMVTKREMHIVKWEWMFQFKPYHEPGTGKTGPYYNIIRFAKKDLLPPVTRTYQVKKGLVHITEGVSPSDFNL